MTIYPLFSTKDSFEKGVVTNIYTRPIISNGVIVGEKYGYGVKVGESCLLAYTTNNKELSLTINDDVYLYGTANKKLYCFK